MPLLIDGYNLLNATCIAPGGPGPGNLERARQALLNTLVESLPAEEVVRTTVVCDASESPWGVAKEMDHRGICVKFAARDDDADSVIERLIAADSAPKRLTVVSSDHRLQRAAKRRRAKVLTADAWLRQLATDHARGPRPGRAASKRDIGPLTPAQVDAWLRYFGVESE